MTANQRDAMLRRAILDPKLTPGSLQLLCRLLLLDVKTPEPFALSNKDAAALTGITDKATLYARIKQLVPAYIVRHELNGCPPTWKFKFKHKGKNEK